MRDWRAAGLSQADQALCRYAELLTHKNAAIEKDSVDELRGYGFDDRAIHDATQVVAYFNYITRVADGLGVEPENFISLWGLDEV
ncbi:MAG TPA: peroxidase [Gemmatimonadetes bacterium]|nr:peroxidase [Gemmatimonadota bacterium]HCW78653.1 peroxidase [Gemmatimonadota bacterium]